MLFLILDSKQIFKYQKNSFRFSPFNIHKCMVLVTLAILVGIFVQYPISLPNINNLYETPSWSEIYWCLTCEKMAVLSSGLDGSRSFWRGFQVEFCQERWGEVFTDLRISEPNFCKNTLFCILNFLTNIFPFHLTF